MTKRVLLLLLAAAATGCSLAPGIHISDAEVTERAHEQGATDFQITVVSPYTIAQLAREQEAAAKARQPDPNVAEFSTYQYKIAPLDVLSVVVWDHPELTSPTGQFRGPEDNGLPVYADGTMFYPFVGYLNVSGQDRHRGAAGADPASQARHQGSPGVGAGGGLPRQARRGDGRGEVCRRPCRSPTSRCGCPTRSRRRADSFPNRTRPA